MGSLLDSLLVLVLVLNLYALGTSRIAVVIRVVALQGFVLAALPLLAHGEIGAESVIISVAAVALKAVIIPMMLFRALRDVQIRREVEPLISTGASMLLGGLGAALALAFAKNLPLTAHDGHSLIVPAALATVLAGFLLLTTRLKAISQVLGYLVLENGIFIFGLVLVDAVPLVVEIGALLDLVVAIFVMGILLGHIRREFSSIDTRALSALKED
ncbi:MAG: hydrogenase [Deltaproteobacteria bacterium]|nr:MAG: hydrogenase [Deltaproteobacteria bacterium]